MISGIASIIWGPCGDWDFLAYHYYNGFAALNNRISIDVMPADIHSFFNPFLDIINYLLINALRTKELLLLFIQGIPYGFLIFSLYLISKKIFYKISDNNFVNSSLILFSTIVGATECIIVSEIGLSYNDITISTMILLALFFILKFQDEQKSKYIIFSGLLCGIAFGCKLTSGIVSAPLILTFIITNYTKGLKYNLKYFGLFCLFGMLGFLLIDGYWMYILYKNFHNPIFPLYNKIFKSNLYTLVNYKDLRFGSLNPLAYFAFPVLWGNNSNDCNVCEYSFFDFRHAFAYFSVVIAGMLLVLKFETQKVFSKTDKQHIFILIYTVISFIFWILMAPILRYFLTILSLTGVLITILISQIENLKTNSLLLIKTLGLILIILSLNYTVPDWGRLDKIIQVPRLPIEKDSVVFLYGNPISYFAALPYDNVRFINLYDKPDGASKDFHKTEAYYEKVESLIQGKKKYLIINKYLIDDDKYYIEVIKPRFVNSKLKCSTIEDISKNRSLNLRSENFYFCEFLD